MTKIALIGYGAMAGYVFDHLQSTDHEVTHAVIRPGREAAATARFGHEIDLVERFEAIDARPALVVDCAGHAGLTQHAPAFLRVGIPVITASIGALADDGTRNALEMAARAGHTQLHLATGAIGALDALCAARVGGLSHVRYSGRKPPQSWLGSPAEEVADLETLTQPVTHFDGSARQAATLYPKNANVAAAVALAGLGFDDTQATLIADPGATGNTHLIEAEGSFGSFRFEITGNSLPDTPRTSALAAMSMVAAVLSRDAAIRF